MVVLGSLATALGVGRPSKVSGKAVIASVAVVRVGDMQFLAKLAETGEYKPVIDRSYSLGDAAKAHAYVDTGRKRGSVILTIEPAVKANRVQAVASRPLS